MRTFSSGLMAWHLSLWLTKLSCFPDSPWSFLSIKSQNQGNLHILNGCIRYNRKYQGVCFLDAELLEQNKNDQLKPCCSSRQKVKCLLEVFVKMCPLNDDYNREALSSDMQRKPSIIFLLQLKGKKVFFS